MRWEIHFDEEIHTLNALPKQGSLCLSAEDIALFLFSHSSYAYENPNIDAHHSIIRYWIANVAQGTFMLKTTLKAFHGKHILTRQISNSMELKDRIELANENIFDELDEEKEAFEEKIVAFSEEMKEEMGTE